MSKRRYLPVALALLAASVTAGVGLGQAKAAGHKGLPFITGGGQNANLAPGGGRPSTSYEGFNGQATGPGTAGTGPNASTVYPAKGQVQIRASNDAAHKTVAAAHGDVVCIANYGPSNSSNNFGGKPGGNVWEIRFRVTHSTVPAAEDFYGSIMVQDNGPHNDYADEDFQRSLLANPSCGNVTQAQLEPYQGQITVHNG